MVFDNDAELARRVEKFTGRRLKKPPRVISDTSNYMLIHPGMVLRLENDDFYIRGDATEGRFGLDDEPKFWVKYAIDLTTGARKIIKLPFYEDYTSRVGPFLIRAHRSPEKESDVLDAVYGNPHFMQGRTMLDDTGNKVRVIDRIKGPSLFHYLLKLEMPHEEYFFNFLPQVMARLLKAIQAIGLLMEQGLQHGDIRSDHLIVESQTSRFVWIDFDYQVSHADFDLWSLGNVLSSTVGKGSLNHHDISRFPYLFPGLKNGGTIEPRDCLMVNTYQVANIGKLYPYIPDAMNHVLMNFSVGTQYFYEDINVLQDHIQQAMSDLPPVKSMVLPG